MKKSGNPATDRAKGKSGSGFLREKFKAFKKSCAGRFGECKPFDSLSCAQSVDERMTLERRQPYALKE
jgi:hypothetical protein